MKKLFKLLLVVGLVVATVGCSSGELSKEEANAAYNAMLQAQQSVESVKMSGTMTGSVDGGGMKMDLSATIDSVMETIKSDSPKLAIKTTVNAFGQETVTEMYYADGITYTNAGGEKTKEETANSLEQLMNNANPVANIDLSIFENYSAKKVNGDYVFTINITQAEMNKFLEEAGQALIPTDEMEISKISMTITSDATTNLQKSINVDAEMAITAEGQKMTIVGSVNFNLSDYGSAKAELPTDLDSYSDSGYGYEENVYDLTHITDNLTYYDEPSYSVGEVLKAGEYIAYSLSDIGGMVLVAENRSADDFVIESFFQNSAIITIKDGQEIEVYDCILVAIDDVKDVDATQPGMYKVGYHLPAGAYTVTAMNSNAEYAIFDDNSKMITYEGVEYVEESSDIELKDGQYVLFENATLAPKK